MKMEKNRNIVLIVNNVRYSYKQRAPVIQIPFIKSLLEFEGEKDEYILQLPENVVGAWKDYARHKNLKSSFFLSPFSPESRIKNVLKKCHVDLAEYLMDHEMLVHFVSCRPTLFSTDFLIKNIEDENPRNRFLVKGNVTTRHKGRIIEELYKRDKQKALELSDRRYDIFHPLLKSEIDTLSAKSRILPSVIDDVNYPFTKAVADLFCSCKWIASFWSVTNPHVNVQSVLSIFTIVHLPGCCVSGLCSHNITRFLFHKNASFIVGIGDVLNTESLMDRKTITSTNDTISFLPSKGSTRITIYPWVM